MGGKMKRRQKNSGTSRLYTLYELYEQNKLDPEIENEKKIYKKPQNHSMFNRLSVLKKIQRLQKKRSYYIKTYQKKTNHHKTENLPNTTTADLCLFQYPPKVEVTTNLPPTTNIAESESFSNLRQNIFIETTHIDTFESKIANDLSEIIDDTKPALQAATISNNLLFTCLICCEEDILIEVILQCGHCLCRLCHDRLYLMENTLQDKRCPVCRSPSVSGKIIHRGEGIMS